MKRREEKERRKGEGEEKGRKKEKERRDRQTQKREKDGSSLMYSTSPGVVLGTMPRWPVPVPSTARKRKAETDHRPPQATTDETTNHRSADTHIQYCTCIHILYTHTVYTNMRTHTYTHTHTRPRHARAEGRCIDHGREAARQRISEILPPLQPRGSKEQASLSHSLRSLS
jgi:hypothetical protein